MPVLGSISPYSIESSSYVDTWPAFYKWRAEEFLDLSWIVDFFMRLIIDALSVELI
jgi:hypothetical protein